MITNDVTSQGVIVQPECKHRCKLRIIVYSRFIFMIGLKKQFLWTEFSIFPLHVGSIPTATLLLGLGSIPTRFDPNWGLHSIPTGAAPNPNPLRVRSQLRAILFFHFIGNGLYLGGHLPRLPVSVVEQYAAVNNQPIGLIKFPIYHNERGRWNNKWGSWLNKCGKWPIYCTIS